MSAKGVTVMIFESLTIATSYAMSLLKRIAINQTYQKTMNILLIISVCVTVPLIPLSLLMKNYKLDQMRSFTPHNLVAKLTPVTQVDQHVKDKVIGQSQHNKSLFEQPEVTRIMSHKYLTLRDHETSLSNE